jgi:hypothetical protein
MPTYVVIFTHSADQCPGVSREVNEFVSAQMLKMASIGKELGVSVTAIHVLMPGHGGVAVLQAPDYAAANQFLMKIGLDRWNDDVTLYQSSTPEEAMALSAERFAEEG